MKMIVIAISFYLIGLMLFNTSAVFDSYWWHSFYFLWDKGKDVLFISAIYFVVKHRYVLWLLIYSIIRFLWELLTNLKAWNANNDSWVMISFLLLTLICSGVFIKESLKWLKQK